MSSYVAIGARDHHGGMPIRTVLVEDSKTIRDALIPTMAGRGDMEIVAIAETVDDAVSALRGDTGHWQLAVIDLMLKRGTGLDVLRALPAHPNQLVVVLSSYTTKRVREECTALGADAIFDKSTQLDAFFDFCAARLGPGH